MATSTRVVTRDAWTAEDSRKEIQKWSKCKPSDITGANTIIGLTHDKLEENVWYFLDTIGTRSARYQEHLNDVLAKKPKLAVGSTCAADVEPLNPASTAYEQYLKVHLRLMKQPAEGAEEEEEEEKGDDDSDDSDYDAVEEVTVTFPNNDTLRRAHASLREEAFELEITMDGICDWLNLSIPDLQVDDTDGVDVIQAVLASAEAHSTAVHTCGKCERAYLEERAELELEVIAYPHSASTRQQLVVHDIDAWDDVERGWRTLVRTSLILHATLMKNMVTLLDPRKLTERASTSVYY
jgi:hypothetical protein